MSEHGQKADEIFNDKAPNYEKIWSHPPESNRRPTDYESVALPTELGWPVRKIADLRELIQAVIGPL